MFYYDIYTVILRCTKPLYGFDDFLVSCPCLDHKDTMDIERVESSKINQVFQLVYSEPTWDVYTLSDGSYLFTTKYTLEYCEVYFSVNTKHLEVFYKDDENHLHNGLVDDIIQFIRISIELFNLRNNIISMHASCIDDQGDGIAFTAVSGVGKSTRASAWNERFLSQFISGDRPAIKLDKNGKCIFVGMPWDGKEGIRKRNQVDAKYILDVRRSNEVRVRHLTMKQKITELARCCFVPTWDTEATAQATAIIIKVATNVGIFRCFFGPTQEDAYKVKDILYNHPEKIIESESEIGFQSNFRLTQKKDGCYLISTRSTDRNSRIRINEFQEAVFREVSYGIGMEDLIFTMSDRFSISLSNAQNLVNKILLEYKEMGILMDY